MRLKRRIVALSVLSAAAAVASLAQACKDSSNTVTGLSTAAPAPSMIVAGTWSGDFHPDSTTCSFSSMTATFQQTGSSVTGTIVGPSCGVAGSFIGSVDGSQIVGRIDMQSCVGGAVSGTVGPSGMVLSIGDLTKPLVTGQKVWFYGGSASLHR